MIKWLIKLIKSNTPLGHIVSVLQWLGFKGVIIVALILMLIGANLGKSALQTKIRKQSDTIATLNGSIANLNEQKAILEAEKKAAAMDLQESDVALSEALKSCSRRVSNAAKASAIPPIQKVIYVKNEKGETMPNPTLCEPLYSVRDIQKAVNSN